MDEDAGSTAGTGGAALRRALEEEVARVEARSDLVDGALRRGRARLRRRRAAGGVASALVLVAGVALVVQLPGRGASTAESAAAGSAESAGPQAASSSAAADAEDGTAAELGPLEDSAAEVAGGFTVRRTVDGSLAVVASPSSTKGSDQARIAGDLTVVTGGCLGFRYDDGTETVVVWPSTTTVLDDAVGVEVPGTGTYRVGDPVEGSGGSADRTFEGPLAGCPGTGVAFLDGDRW